MTKGMTKGVRLYILPLTIGGETAVSPHGPQTQIGIPRGVLPCDQSRQLPGEFKWGQVFSNIISTRNGAKSAPFKAEAPAPSSTPPLRRPAWAGLHQTRKFEPRSAQRHGRAIRSLWRRMASPQGLTRCARASPTPAACPSSVASLPASNFVLILRGIHHRDSNRIDALKLSRSTDVDLVDG